MEGYKHAQINSCERRSTEGEGQTLDNSSLDDHTLRCLFFHVLFDLSRQLRVDEVFVPASCLLSTWTDGQKVPALALAEKSAFRDRMHQHGGRQTIAIVLSGPCMIAFTW